MSCGTGAVPGEDGGKIKLAGGACCSSCFPAPVILSCDTVEVSKRKCGFRAHGLDTCYKTSAHAGGICISCGDDGDTDEVDCDTVWRTLTVCMQSCDCCKSGEGCSTGSCHCCSAEGGDSPCCFGGTVCKDGSCVSDFNGCATWSFPLGAEAECGAPDDGCPLGIYYSEAFMPPIDLCGIEFSDFCTGNCPSDSSTWPSFIWNRGSGAICVASSISVDDEYTTEQMVDHVYASIPEYDDDYNDHPCSALYHMIDGEGQLTIRRFKPRFSFDAATYDRVLTYSTFFAPDVGASELVDSFEIPIPAGTTSYDGDEVLEPSTNGSVTVNEVLLACTDPGTQCMTVSATLSGSLQLSNACEPCFEETSSCITDVSATATHLMSTNVCCLNAGDLCSNSMYGDFPCLCATCNFVGGGLEGYHCGNVQCVGRTTVPYIYRTVPDEDTSGCGIGGTPCSCGEAVCPLDEGCFDGFQVVVGLHNVPEGGENICFDTPGYWVSIFVYLQKAGCPNEVAHDFDDTGLVIYLGATDPAGSTHTFDFTEDDLMYGTPGCGMELLTYQVVMTLP
jgi:hypothetical protein